MLSAVLGFILSVVTGGVLTFVFGWSGSAVLLGTVVGAAGGTIVGFLLFIGPEQLAKAWRPAAYVVWRAWAGLEWVASWASLLLPAILTVVVSALLSRHSAQIGGAIPDAGRPAQAAATGGPSYAKPEVGLRRGGSYPSCSAFDGSPRIGVRLRNAVGLQPGCQPRVG